jgi:hypothetical protein
MVFALSSCEQGKSIAWSDLGDIPAPASTALNHTPMVTSGDRVLVGTADGLWARALAGNGGWARSGLEGIAVFATRGHPTIDSTIFAAGRPATDVQAAPFYRSDDGGHTWIAAVVWPRNPLDQSTEPFFDLAVAADDPQRLYANLSGPSIAVSTDGGLTWTLANGETEVFFGDPCVIHVLQQRPGTLFQGCEAPLDNAWVATYDIEPADPHVLGNFTFVAGGPDLALENRRPNGLASGRARPDTLYAGLEGALIALDESGFEFVFRAEGESADPPYAYIAAIWLDPVDPDHLIFGGGVNGENLVLSLFETRDHGATLAHLRPPAALRDPAVEQIVEVDEGELAVLISEAGEVPEGERPLRLFLLKSRD